MLAIVHSVAAASVRAQEPAPAGPPPVTPPGTRVDRQDPQGDEVLLDPEVKALQGKPVRSVAFWKQVRNGALPLEGNAADSYVRGLLTRVGQPFEARNIATDCSNLWTDRRLVVQVLADRADDEVAVHFVIVREVEVYEGIEWKGLVNLDRPTVDGLLGIYPDRQVTRTEGEAMRKVLLARYHRDGYAHCSVALEDRLAADAADAGADAAAPPTPTPTSSPKAPPASTTPPARRLLRFVIDEGPKVTVRRVTFLGNTSFAATPLFGTFGSGEFLVRDAHIDSDPAYGLISGGAYSREVLEEDLDKLRMFYRSRGFLDATVDVAAVQFTADREHVDLSFVVVEGPRYRIRSVRVQHVQPDERAITGQPLHPAAQLERELKVVPGEFYDHDRLQRDVLALQDFYGRRGHPPWNFPGMSNSQSGCQVFLPKEIYGTTPEVDVVYQISEGVPKKLRDVVIRGNRFTKDEVIRRRVKVFPGELIDMVEVRRSLRAIEQTRFFQDPASLRGPRLQLEPVDGDPEYVDIGLDLADGPTGRLQWGVGISTGQGVQANITFNKSNFDLWKLPSSPNPITVISEVLDNKAFHGGGQNLGLLLAPGDRYSQFQLTWSDPDIFAQHIDTWELRVGGRRIIRRLPDGYTSDVLGADVGLSHWFSDQFNLGVSVRQETVDIDNLSADATSLAYDAEGQTELRGLRLKASYRDQDDFLRPTQGLELSLSGEVVGGPLGGEESLTKLTHSAHVYVPLAENEMKHRTVLHLEQFFGIANEFGGSDDVFLTERFYLGGGNLRGFDFRRAGPKQFDRPLGGEATWYSTVEVFFPLVATRLEGEVRDRELLRWVLFTDFGLLGLGLDDPTFRELRASSGIGLRIEIPVLDIPIALDLAWPWRYEESDDRRQLYFSISR